LRQTDAVSGTVARYVTGLIEEAVALIILLSDFHRLPVRLE
jgi:hypothetical protein